MRISSTEYFIRLAWFNAITLSKDPKTQVGAVVVASHERHFSTGVNGFPPKLPEKDHWHVREEKLKRVIHAEMNAIHRCPFDTYGSTLYCTHSPCVECTKMLPSAGIVRVVFNRWYDHSDKEFLKEIAEGTGIGIEIYDNLDLRAYIQMLQNFREQYE